MVGTAPVRLCLRSASLTLSTTALCALNIGEFGNPSLDAAIARDDAENRPNISHTNNTETSMARVRCITEMGMGVDVHGRDATKAAKRAVSDAIRHSSLGFFRMVGKTSKDMFVDVTIAVPNPEAVDTAAVAKELPYGTVTVTAVKGGLEIPAEQGSDSIVIANAAVIVSLEDDKPA
jgi:uncharacterized protein (TIGR02058 family)